LGQNILRRGDAQWFASTPKAFSAGSRQIFFLAKRNSHFVPVPTVQRQTKKKREHYRCVLGLKNGAAGPWEESLVHVGKSNRVI
jgi:hypothetical protein